MYKLTQLLLGNLNPTVQICSESQCDSPYCRLAAHSTSPNQPLLTSTVTCNFNDRVDTARIKQGIIIAEKERNEREKEERVKNKLR